MPSLTNGKTQNGGSHLLIQVRLHDEWHARFVEKRAVKILLLVLIATHSSFSQPANEPVPLTLTADKDSAVRFYFVSSTNNYFHVPIVFRVVADNDPRLNTAPLIEEGRTCYISLSEMRAFFAALSSEALSWDESKTMEKLGPSKDVRGDGRMDIKILTSAGTAKSGIPTKQMCDTLQRLDSALQSPRAVFEFQHFRWEFGCKIPNFDPKKYPVRIP